MQVMNSGLTLSGHSSDHPSSSCGLAEPMATVSVSRILRWVYELFTIVVRKPAFKGHVTHSQDTAESRAFSRSTLIRRGYLVIHWTFNELTCSTRPILVTATALQS